ncbi:MAG: hypothetical protein WD069_02850 [Planctomycetales bacterium]
MRLRVPRADGSLLAHPPSEEAIAAARANSQSLSHAEIDVQGRTLVRLRREARAAALAAARRYTAELTGEKPPAPGPEALLFVDGHQPSLFHPGVWVKNFAIAALAAQAHGTALHIVVDNDVLTTTRIRVPAGNRDAPEFDREPFDADRPRIPWEEARVLDPEVFASFGERIAARMAKWGVVPLAARVWPEAIRAVEATRTLRASGSLASAEHTGSLRDAFTAARHRIEVDWGARNFELPLSRLCELDPFLWFASHLLVRAEEFRAIHNEVLDEFRRVNRVRSRTHPVPALKAHDGWIETPFRVWRTGAPVRRNVFVQQRAGVLALSDGSDTFAELPIAPGRDACCAVEVLRKLPAQGIRFRTRALTTTLFARLFLADLFVHGTGGAKYDEMTDRIIGRFFGIEPPAFQTLSATLHLPLAEPFDVAPEDATRLETLLRELEFNPDRHLPPHAPAEARALAAEKRQLIAEQRAARGERAPRSVRRSRSRANHARYRRFREIDQALRPFVAGQRRQIENDLAELRRQLAANIVLRDRDASFALYPEDKLRRFLTGLASQPG